MAQIYSSLNSVATPPCQQFIQINNKDETIWVCIHLAFHASHLKTICFLFTRTLFTSISFTPIQIALSIVEFFRVGNGTRFLVPVLEKAVLVGLNWYKVRIISYGGGKPETTNSWIGDVVTNWQTFHKRIDNKMTGVDDLKRPLSFNDFLEFTIRLFIFIRSLFDNHHNRFSNFIQTDM